MIWRDDDEQRVLCALGVGDALAAMKYQDWAGLRPGGPNLVGFDPRDRHAERVRHALDWFDATLAKADPAMNSLSGCALTCFLLWTDARGGFDWRGRPALERLVSAWEDRPSFRSSRPQPWP